VQARSDDGTLTSDNPMIQWAFAMEEAMAKTGRVPPSEEQLRTRLEKVGFVDVQSFTLKMPVGPWAKDEYGTILISEKKKKMLTRD
jgi:hypothetical protein